MLNRTPAAEAGRRPRIEDLAATMRREIESGVRLAPVCKVPPFKGAAV